MQRMPSIALCLALLFSAAALPASAAEKKESFLVLPFSVQGPEGFAYLERSIPQMFTSRLFWEGRLEPATADMPAGQPAVDSENAAEQVRARHKADYVIWGTVTLVGETCSLDVRVRNKAGKVWPYSREARTNQLIPAITAVIEVINREVFGRAASLPAATPVAREEPGRVNQMNPDLLMNQTSNRSVYLNPQFRYAGGSGEDARIRSQSMRYAAVGMEVVDADGDGRNEIFILGDDHTLYAYRFGREKLDPLDTFALPRVSTVLSIRSLPGSSGKAWIIVNMADADSRPMASILTFDKTFKEELRNIKYFLNVVRRPSSHTPTLVGQQAQPPRLFRPGVHEMVKTRNGLSEGIRLNLPPDANALNFAYLPASSGQEDNTEKIVLLSDRETLRVYTPKGSRLSESEEVFSGSSAGLQVGNALPGLSQDTVSILGVYYIPMRLLPVDLDQDGTYELIVNKPISTASMLFDRYRSYPQSEIHSLFWDGLGMNLAWKTRRIKGSMADYAIADANNDGVMDLVTCVNSHPGALGVQARRAMIILYPLDLSRMDSETPASPDDIFD